MEPMEIDRRELKRIARERMKLTHPSFWVVTLIYFCMTTLLVSLFNFVPGSDSGGLDTLLFFLTILLTLYTTVVDFGYTLWSLWTFRQLDPGANSLTQGFSVAGRVLLLQISIYVRTLGWTMLLYFVAAIPFSMLLTLALTAAPLSESVLILLMIPFLLFFYAAVWIIMLRYSLAPYLLADRPDDGFDAAIRRSVELMRGWKWELFKLKFSFLGWQLLSFVITIAVTVGFLIPSDFFSLLPTGDLPQLQTALYSVLNGSMYILVSNLAPLPLLLWLHPYQEVTYAGFYDARLRLHRASTPTPPPV